MKRILALLLLVAICVGGYWYYQKYKREQANTDGSYTCVGCLPPDRAAAYAKYDHGEGPDPEASKSSSSQTPALNQSSQSASAADNPAGYTSSGAGNNQATPVVIQPGNTSVTRPTLSATPMNNPTPAMDSIPPNPQNGIRFGGSGSGNYQWYREGNLTWRINTQTGTSCIIYATQEEWRKRTVMEHGCGRDA